MAYPRGGDGEAEDTDCKRKTEKLISICEVARSTQVILKEDSKQSKREKKKQRRRRKKREGCVGIVTRGKPRLRTSTLYNRVGRKGEGRWRLGEELN